jgi:hypothetical protein
VGWGKTWSRDKRKIPVQADLKREIDLEGEQEESHWEALALKKINSRQVVEWKQEARYFALYL